MERQPSLWGALAASLRPCYHTGAWNTNAPLHQPWLQVVCRQLGKKGGTPRTHSYYGPGKQGTVGLVVDQIVCATGMEPNINITNCYVGVNWSFEPSQMMHDYGWGVECTDPAGGNEWYWMK